MLAIYAPYVEHTAISFEYEVPSLNEFAGRIRQVSAGYPWLVAERDGRVVGYAYAHVFHVRKAYRFSTELSIYVRRDERGSGIGSALYDALEERLRQAGFRVLYACIAVTPRPDDPYLTDGSVRFHTRRGFHICGRFTGCAEKFGLIYDMVYMEKHL